MIVEEAGQTVPVQQNTAVHKPGKKALAEKLDDDGKLILEELEN